VKILIYPKNILHGSPVVIEDGGTVIVMHDDNDPVMVADIYDEETGAIRAAHNRDPEFRHVMAQISGLKVSKCDTLYIPPPAEGSRLIRSPSY